jgi:1,4-alpha-glucan branching enzyme
MSKGTKKNIGVVLHKDGASFRVWAPFAEAVSVTGSFNGWDRHPMESEGDGYWFADINGVVAGEEYKFAITNNGKILLRNDPRALQLTTDSGNGIIVDKEFDWGTDTFVAPPVNEQVIYELHIGTFNRIDASTQGTFRTAIERLDYLAALGINMVEIMPIGSMYMDRGWGYASDYIYAVESLYGGRYEFLEFVKAAHERGIGVVLDVVYNHFGPDTSMDLWQFDGWSQDGKGGVYFYNDWRRVTPWGDTRPDYGRPEVQQYITDNVRMWLQDCSVDGLRVDSTIFIRNVKGQNNDPSNDLADGWKLLQEITATSHKVKPAAIVIGEDTSGNEYITKPVEEGGAGFASQWEVGFPRLVRNLLVPDRDENRSLHELAAILTQAYNGNAFQRVIYADSHDSAANGSARLNEELSPADPGSIFARRRSLIAAAIILTTPGMPMLFQGQEFMEGGSFNDWQELHWERAERFKGMVLAYQHLIALRKNEYNNTKGLTGGSCTVLHQDDSNKILAYHRWDEGGSGDDVVVIINFGHKSQNGYELAFPGKGTWTVRFNSDWKGYSEDFENVTTSTVEVSDKSVGRINIGAYSVLILSQDSEAARI